jgi:hypothetical protein
MMYCCSWGIYRFCARIGDVLGMGSEKIIVLMGDGLSGEGVVS